MSNGFLAHLPAEQNDAAFHLAREIEQANVEVFYLDADGIDFSESIFGPLFGLGALGLAAGNGYHVNVRAAVQKDAVIERLHFGLNFFHQLFAADGIAQQGFKNRQKGVSFIEREGSIRHGRYNHSNANRGSALVVNQRDLPCEGSGVAAVFTSIWSCCAGATPGG